MSCGGETTHNLTILYFTVTFQKIFRMLGSDSKASSGSQDSSSRQRSQLSKAGSKESDGATAKARQDTGYSTESSDSRKMNKMKKVRKYLIMKSTSELFQNTALTLILESTFISCNKILQHQHWRRTQGVGGFM